MEFTHDQLKRFQALLRIMKSARNQPLASHNLMYVWENDVKIMEEVEAYLKERKTEPSESDWSQVLGGAR